MADPLALHLDPGALTGGPRLPQVGRGLDAGRIAEAARDFEAVFLAQMLKPMFGETTPEPPFGGGFAEDVWRDVLADELGKSVASAGGIGIADAVVREVLRLQEAATATAPPAGAAP